MTDPWKCLGYHPDRDCRECGNTGWLTVCPKCQGWTRLADHPCDRCSEKGYVPAEAPTE